MGCNSCSSGGGCSPKGCQSNGTCTTNGCNKLDVYDWLSHMDMPSNYKPFNIIEVRFKGSRKEFFVNENNLYMEMGEMIVVESSTNGYDIGHVSLMGELVRLQLKKQNTKEEAVLKKVYRKPTPSDVEKYEAAKALEWETMHKARTLALQLGLSMKISDVDYQGDKSKATFYYTADGRVDFRELIKSMAETFRIRIEMRQIGMRQEASRLGGIGSCGRELCCSTWLTDFKTVSTSAARYQNLSLNTLKLAGQCGKLKCCLNYELDTYMDALKDIPTDINKLETIKGNAYLQKTDIFKRLMWFSFQGDDSWIPLPIDRVKEIQQQNLKGIKPEDIKDLTITPVVKEKERTYDYENVVGQDSLTRLDENKNKKRNSKNRSRNKNNRLEKTSGGNKAAINKDPAKKATVENSAITIKTESKESPPKVEGQARKKKRYPKRPKSSNKPDNPNES
jgi:cell fate regulator YaaT (PSP1 superfamily)